MKYKACFRRLERDDEYRPRVVAACQNAEIRLQARCAVGSSLDSVGDFVGVQRRIIEDVA